MSNEILKRLVKIVESQQKTILKLAQLSGDIEYIEQFIKNSLALFLLNNGLFAKQNHVLEQVSPNHYKISITLAPATKTPLSESVANDAKAFLTARIQADPKLQSKSFDLDVKLPF
jgi:hypothetical protein